LITNHSSIVDKILSTAWKTLKVVVCIAKENNHL